MDSIPNNPLSSVSFSHSTPSQDLEVQNTNSNSSNQPLGISKDQEAVVLETIKSSSALSQQSASSASSSSLQQSEALIVSSSSLPKSKDSLIPSLRVVRTGKDLYNITLSLKDYLILYNDLCETESLCSMEYKLVKPTLLSIFESVRDSCSAKENGTDFYGQEILKSTNKDLPILIKQIKVPKFFITYDKAIGAVKDLQNELSKFISCAPKPNTSMPPKSIEELTTIEFINVSSEKASFSLSLKDYIKLIGNINFYSHRGVTNLDKSKLENLKKQLETCRQPVKINERNLTQKELMSYPDKALQITITNLYIDRGFLCWNNLSHVADEFQKKINRALISSGSLSSSSNEPNTLSSSSSSYSLSSKKQFTDLTLSSSKSSLSSTIQQAIVVPGRLAQLPIVIPVTPSFQQSFSSSSLSQSNNLSPTTLQRTEDSQTGKFHIKVIGNDLYTITLSIEDHATLLRDLSETERLCPKNHTRRKNDLIKLKESFKQKYTVIDTQTGRKLNPQDSTHENQELSIQFEKVEINNNLINGFLGKGTFFNFQNEVGKQRRLSSSSASTLSSTSKRIKKRTASMLSSTVTPSTSSKKSQSSFTISSSGSLTHLSSTQPVQDAPEPARDLPSSSLSSSSSFSSPADALELQVLNLIENNKNDEAERIMDELFWSDASAYERIKRTVDSLVTNSSEEVKYPLSTLLSDTQLFSEEETQASQVFYDRYDLFLEDTDR